MVARAAQRIASLAIRKKIASRMVPAMIKIVVELISSCQLFVVSCQFLDFGLGFWSLNFELGTLNSLLPISRSYDGLDITAHVKVAFNIDA
jgi:hypothetical protein